MENETHYTPGCCYADVEQAEAGYGYGIGTGYESGNGDGLGNGYGQGDPFNGNSLYEEEDE